MTFQEALSVLVAFEESISDRLKRDADTWAAVKEAIVTLSEATGASVEFLSDRPLYTGEETLETLTEEYNEWSLYDEEELDDPYYEPYLDEPDFDFYDLPTQDEYFFGLEEEYDYTADDRNFDAANGR